jgi:DNA-binding transcriptional ArsR family regulator
MGSENLNPQLLPRIARWFAALADENRLRLLLQLKAGPANVTQLTAGGSLSQASVSKHLAVLRQAGLVDLERRGTSSYYFVRQQEIFDLCGLVCNGVLGQLAREHDALTSVITNPSGTHSPSGVNP